MEIPKTDDQERRKLISSIANKFIESYEKSNSLKIALDYDLLDNSVTLYYNQLDKSLKKNIVSVLGSKKINVFKIISLTELCVMYCKPISHPSFTQINNRKLNAELSYYIARSMITIWVKKFGVELNPAQLPKLHKNELESFKENHIEWLARREDHQIQFPVYPNTHSWKLFFFILSNCTKESGTLLRNEP